MSSVTSGVGVSGERCSFTLKELDECDEPVRDSEGHLFEKSSLDYYLASGKIACPINPKHTIDLDTLQKVEKTKCVSSKILHVNTTSDAEFDADLWDKKINPERYTTQPILQDDDTFDPVFWANYRTPESSQDISSNSLSESLEPNDDEFDQLEIAKALTTSIEEQRQKKRRVETTTSLTDASDSNSTSALMQRLDRLRESIQQSIRSNRPLIDLTDSQDDSSDDDSDESPKSQFHNTKQ